MKTQPPEKNGAEGPQKAPGGAEGAQLNPPPRQTADAPPASDSAELGLKAFAAHLGVRPSYITALKQDGRLVLSEDGKRVRVAESLARIEATRNPARADVADRHAARRGAALPPAVPPDAGGAGQGEGADGDADNAPYQESRAFKERYLALAAKRDYDISMRTLLPAAAVTADIASAITTLRARLEMLPDVLAPVLIGEADEGRLRNLIADEIERALADLAADFHARAAQWGREA